jgi:hypothetical protein
MVSVFCTLSFPQARLRFDADLLPNMLLGRSQPLGEHEPSSREVCTRDFVYLRFVVSDWTQ